MWLKALERVVRRRKSKEIVQISPFYRPSYSYLNTLCIFWLSMTQGSWMRLTYLSTTARRDGGIGSVYYDWLFWSSFDRGWCLTAFSASNLLYTECPTWKTGYVSCRFNFDCVGKKITFLDWITLCTTLRHGPVRMSKIPVIPCPPWLHQRKTFFCPWYNSN